MELPSISYWENVENIWKKLELIKKINKFWRSFDKYYLLCFFLPKNLNLI